MGEPEHAVGVRVLAGEEARATGRAGRGGTEGLPEQHPFLGQSLDPGRRHRVPVRLDIPPGVVRVQVEDVWQRGHVALFGDGPPSPESGQHTSGRVQPFTSQAVMAFDSHLVAGYIPTKPMGKVEIVHTGQRRRQSDRLSEPISARCCECKYEVTFYRAATACPMCGTVDMAEPRLAVAAAAL